MKLKFASILVLAALLLGMTAPAYAQKSLDPESKYRGWEVNGGISGIPYVNMLLIYAFSTLGHPNEAVEGTPGGEFGLPFGLDLNGRYNFNRWLSVGINSDIQYFSGPKTHTENKGTENETTVYCGRHSLLALSIMPTLRITYYKARRFSVYSQGSIGLVYYGFDKYCNNSAWGYPEVNKTSSGSGDSGSGDSGDGGSSDSGSSLNISFPFQTAPIGFTFGSKWYFYLEAQWGLMNYGAGLGVGYRF